MTIDVITHEQPTACRGVCPDVMDDEDNITNTSPLAISSADTMAASLPSKDITTVTNATRTATSRHIPNNNDDIEHSNEDHRQKIKRTRKSARPASEAQIDEKEAK
jgi:hypothetical protein